MGKKPPLSETHPEVALEAVGWNPDDYSHGSDKRMRWKCSLSHEYEAAIKHRTFSNSGCPYCANQKVLPGFNDLKTSDPELAMEAFGWDPSHEFSSSIRSKEWQCESGHVFEATIRNRRRGDGCPYCSGRRVTPGLNDLMTLNPSLASELVDLDPSTVSIGSGKKPTWQCAKGHRWKTSIANRALSNTGCPVCDGKQVETGFNDLASKFPRIALEADGWDPSAVLAGSHSRRNWKCSEGHTWQTIIDHRTNKGSNCPYCSGRNAISGKNDLASLFPEIAKQAIGWDPTEVLPNSAKKVRWVCSKGHEWSAQIYSRLASNHEGCPYCSGKSVLEGFNDLATLNPALAREAFDWDASKYSSGSGAKKKWICSEGHIWKATISSRTSGNGCPTCSTTGFDPNKDGWLYFLRHDHWNLLQIGITNFPENRLSSHKKLGWQVLEVRGAMDGMIAREWETSILRMLRKRGADLGNPSVAGKFDGFSECWAFDSLPAQSLQELMELVRVDEN